MRRDLHDDMGHARIRHLPKQGLEHEWFRGGERGREFNIPPLTITIAIINRTDHPHRQPLPAQDTLQEIADRGLAVGAGDSNQGQS